MDTDREDIGTLKRTGTETWTGTGIETGTRKE